MENKTEESLPENLTEYIDTKIRIIKLKTIDKAGGAISGLIAGILLLTFAWLTILFLSFSAAFAISEATQKGYLGFLLVGGFYLFLAALTIFLKEKLITMPIINRLLRKYYYTQQEKKSET